MSHTAAANAICTPIKTADPQHEFAPGMLSKLAPPAPGEQRQGTDDSGQHDEPADSDLGALVAAHPVGLERALHVVAGGVGRIYRLPP